ncbi:putative hexose phosphate transport protein [Symbiodinium microadriaticum]|uniref:Putative hexose phosphate transport protein n=1 Tax=Symbiodinium microadriaticum TaxID=2951 RepID=A0A1Q9D1P1_SYMMI|nr:putative hexose phosphate transport protein [Symbiodinium microadriaticum]CAE7199313.1 uhpC [Symbiodinium microadriaticum]
MALVQSPPRIWSQSGLGQPLARPRPSPRHSFPAFSVTGQGQASHVPGKPKWFLGPSGLHLRRRAAKEPTATNTKLVWAKWSTFWACFFGYSVCYFTRQSLSYTAPVLRQAMGWKGLAEIGKLQSLFPLAYGSSRFLGGLLGDLMSPKRVFALGLFICSLLNIAFGLSSTLPQFAFFWLLNGCFQGLAAPPCVKMITNWFDPKERGFWWSVWHASINLGGFLCPFFAGTLAGTFGWRYGMLGPGFLGLLTVFLCLLAMRDGPIDSKGGPDAKAVKAKIKPEPEVSLMEGIVLNPVQWALGIAYMLVYVCRQGLSVWGIFYLMQTGKISPGAAAALFSGFELGGFLGNLTAGSFSDFLLRRARPGDGEVGQRAKVVCVYFLATLFLLPALSRVPSSHPWLQYVLLLALGHFLCGAQLLLPLVANESAPKAWSTTATGFIGWIGYFGAALSGFPLSKVVTALGWPCYFTVLTAAAGCGALLVLPLRNLRSWRQKLEES